MSPAPADTARARRLLDVIRVVAVLDALLLVPLVLNVTGVIDVEAVVTPLGMVHGLGFVALVVLCARGVVEGFWGWWFPALTVVTGGPPGSLIGDLRLRRRLRA